MSWLAFIGGVAALGGYWMLTGEVPAMVRDVERWLGAIDLSRIGVDGLDVDGSGRLGGRGHKGHSDARGGRGAGVLFPGPIARIFSWGDGSGDVDIVIKTIGLLLAVLGALIVFGVF